MKIKYFGKPVDYKEEKKTSINFPEVSIVIPSYNAEKTLEKTVYSALSQDTKTKYNIIIVDDGSKKPVVESIGKLGLDSKIKIIRKKNGGRSSAMNLGAILSGSKIIRLDADDELTSNAVESLNNYFKKGNVSYLYSDGFWIGPLPGWKWEEHSPVKLEKNSLVNPWIKRDFSPSLLLREMYLGHARMFSRESFLKVGGYNEKYNISGEDWDFALKISEIGNIERVPKKLHKYYLLETGATKTADEKIKLLHHQEIIRKTFQRRGLTFNDLEEDLKEIYKINERIWKKLE